VTGTLPGPHRRRATIAVFCYNLWVWR